MNASLPFGPPINTDIDYYQAYCFFFFFFCFFLFFFIYLFILFLVNYAILVMHGL